MVPSDRLVLGAFIASVLLGGLNAVAIRFSNVELPPFFGATVRFGFASLVLFLIVAARGIPLPRGRALLGAVIFGSLGLGTSFALAYWALQTVQAGLGQVILSLVPLMTFFFALAHGQEPFRWRALGGSLLAIGGVALVFRDQLDLGTPVLPLLAIVAGAAFIAESGVILKGFPGSHPVTTNAVAMAVAAAFNLSLSLLARETPVVPTLAATWAAVLYLVLPGSVVVFGLFVFVLKRWSASVTSYQFVLLPFVAIAAGAMLAGETVTLGFLFGGALVLLGVYVGALYRPPARRQALVQSLEPPTSLDRAA